MGTDLVNYDKAYAEAAEGYARQARSGGAQFLSTQAGVLSFGEESLPGNQLCAIILDAVLENTFYATRFNPDSQIPPKCYAFGRNEAELAPHPSMQADLNYFEPQHFECAGCPMAQWGTSDTGRGKACSNRTRLALIPAGMYVPRGRNDFELQLFDDVGHYETADVAFLKLPVTSGRLWDNYVKMLRLSHRRPPFGVVTRIWLESDPKTQFKVNFELIETLPDEYAPAIMARHQQAIEEIEQGYQPPSPEQLAPPQGARNTGFRRR